MVSIRQARSGDEDVIVELIRELQTYTSGRRWLFPNYRNPQMCMCSTTINRALERMGLNGKDSIGFSAHGFRATARTLLDEVLKFPIERIEQQLAHQVRDMHGRAYNRTRYLDERKVMMQAWSDYLDSLKT